jgi:hypothetical protein
VLGVLAAEPRDGVWSLTQGLLQRDPEPALVVNVIASILATALLCRFAWKRRAAWMSRSFDRNDQLVLMFGLVLVANGVMSYAYTKDVIMSPAGVFFAAAVYVACRDVVQRPSWPSRTVLAFTLAWLTVLSCSWAIRAVGIHANLARAAVRVREQWAYVDDWLVRRGSVLNPREAALKHQLQNDAVLRHPMKPTVREEWTRLFDID